MCNIHSNGTLSNLKKKKSKRYFFARGDDISLSAPLKNFCTECTYTGHGSQWRVSPTCALGPLPQGCRFLKPYKRRSKKTQSVLVSEPKYFAKRNDVKCNVILLDIPLPAQSRGCISARTTWKFTRCCQPVLWGGALKLLTWAGTCRNFNIYGSSFDLPF